MSLPVFNNDVERLDWIAAHFYSGVLSDACDAEGFRNQALGSDIRPLDESLNLVGRAKTVVWAPMFHIPERPYDNEIAAVDSVKPGDVLVMNVGRSEVIVPWGELLSTATRARGGRGAVLDGLVRDTKRIREMKLPVHCVGRRPLDSRGRGIVMAFDVPIAIDGVAIAPGDLIFGDVDGVVVVPSAIEDAVVRRAWEKISAENTTREELESGMRLAEVFERHGIL